MDQNFNLQGLAQGLRGQLPTSTRQKTANGKSVFPLADNLKEKKNVQTQKKADLLLDVFVDGLVQHGQTREKAEVFKTNPKIRDQLEKEVKKLETRTVQENLAKKKASNLKDVFQDVKPRYMQPKVSYAIPNIERPKPWRGGGGAITASASKYTRPLVSNQSAFFGQDGPHNKMNQGGIAMKSKSQNRPKSLIDQARKSQIQKSYGKITMDTNMSSRSRSSPRYTEVEANTDTSTKWGNSFKILEIPSEIESTKDESACPFDFAMSPSPCPSASKLIESPLASNANACNSKPPMKFLAKSVKSLSKTKVGLSSKTDDSALGPADVKEIASNKKVQKPMSELELRYKTSLNPMDEPFSASLDLAGFKDEEISLQLDGRRITVTAKRVRRKDLNARKVTEILDVPPMVNMNSLKIGRTQAGVLIIEEVLPGDNLIPIN